MVMRKKGRNHGGGREFELKLIKYLLGPVAVAVARSRSNQR